MFSAQHVKESRDGSERFQPRRCADPLRTIRYTDRLATSRILIRDSMDGDERIARDRLIALMVAEMDAELNGRGAVATLEWPEERNRATKAVELRARDEVLEMVVEHTRIESYDEQIKDHVFADKIFGTGGGGPRVPGNRRAALYALGIPYGALARIPFAKRDHVGEILTVWTIANIDHVPVNDWSGRPTGQLVGEHTHVPFSWTLFHQFGGRDMELVDLPSAQVVSISYSRGLDHAQLRLERLTTAYNDKVPKLIAAAGESRRSILVLEDRDWSGSSPRDVMTSLREITRGRPMPSAIYLLHHHGDPTALKLYDAGEWIFDYCWLRFSDQRCAQLNLTLAPTERNRRPWV